MPYTVKVSAALARHLLAHPHPSLRRRLSVLKLTPFPVGSRALNADARWHPLTVRLPNLQGFVYGTNHDAVVYTYDPESQTATIQLAIVDGEIHPS